MYAIWLQFVAIWLVLQVPIGKGDKPPVQKSGDNQQQQANANLPPPNSAPIAQSGENKAKATTRSDIRDTTSNRANVQPVEQPALWFQYLAGIVMLFFTGALAVYASVQTRVSTRQWEVNERQWKAMADQNKIMEDQIKQGDRTIAKMGEQIELARQQLEQMRLNNRAWLGVTQPIIKELVADQQVDCVVPIKNAGNTPGFIETAAILCLLVKGKMANDPIPLIEAHEIGIGRESPVPPNNAINFHVRQSVTFNAEEIRQIVSGKWILCVCGYVRYLETCAAEKQHNTRFCFTYDPGTQSLLAYEKFNYMD